MNDYKNKMLNLAAIGVLFLSLGAQAQTVYQLDRTVGAGTVRGTIETDGTTGPLTPENILSWSLEADDGSGEHSPFTIGSDTGGGLTGAGWGYFSATATELLFDFESAYTAGYFADVQFFGGGADFSFNYGFAADSNNGYGKKENLVHFFPGGEPHYVESLRAGVMVVGTTGEPNAYCSGPGVGMGEVMAGLQASLTGGVHTVDGAPEAFYGAINYEERRGFIVPENGISSVQCDSDHILIGEYFATQLDRFDSIKDARDWVSTLWGGRYAEYYLEIDGNRVDHIQTGVKIGNFPDGPRVAFFNAGYVIEPYSLAPGPHTATFVLVRDPGNDGIPPFNDIRLPADFTIVESGITTP